MNLNKYSIPVLGIACISGAFLVMSGMRIPVELESTRADGAEVRIPEGLVLDAYIPTMEEVIAKHLFVPEREATGENAFPDLVVKGVYVGTQRNVVFSLKSNPTANLRIWQGDEDAAIAQVEDDRDPRKPIAEFLSEWEIKSIDFVGVTVKHIITGEVETYEVGYEPLKHVKDNAAAGYGQGAIADTASAGGKPARANAAAAPAAASARPAGGNAEAIAGRVGQYMKRLSPEQRKQFMNQLKEQNGSAGNQEDASDSKNKTRPNGKKSGDKKKKR